MDGPGRLLTTSETVLEDKINSPGGVSELLTTGTTALEGPDRLLKQEQQCWRYQGGFYNMRVSAGGGGGGVTREVINRRRNSA